jgi:hypothetical protein
MNNLILHLHPAQVPKATLRFTYTWGLGGLSALLFLLLSLTGAIEQLNPEGLFKRLDVMADRRLRDVQSLCSFRETEVLSD